MSQVRKGSRRLREMRVEDAGPPPTQEPLQAVGGRPARGPGAPRQFRRPPVPTPLRPARPEEGQDTRGGRRRLLGPELPRPDSRGPRFLRVPRPAPTGLPTPARAPASAAVFTGGQEPLSSLFFSFFKGFIYWRERERQRVQGRSGEGAGRKPEQTLGRACSQTWGSGPPPRDPS